jgi:anti-anti-sigma factor
MDERPTDVDIEHPASDQAVVVFRGEHDVADADVLRETLSRLVSDYELVVADFTEAAFVDSVVINVLLETKREASARLHRFRVQLGTESRVERVFEVAGVLPLLEFARTRAEALGGEARG